MSNLSVTEILEFAVFGLAVVQAMTILLTIRRERDIEDLRELIDQQRLHLAELTAWLAGRNSLQPRQLKSGREPRANVQMAEPEPTPKELPDPMQCHTPDDEAVGAWEGEMATRLRLAGKEGAQLRQAPEWRKDLLERQRTSTTEDPLKRKINTPGEYDPDEDHEVGAREIGHSLEPEPTIAPKQSVVSPPPTAEEELERATKAINCLIGEFGDASKIVPNSNGESVKRDEP
jgi:hypothetical protein